LEPIKIGFSLVYRNNRAKARQTPCGGLDAFDRPSPIHCKNELRSRFFVAVPWLAHRTTRLPSSVPNRALTNQQSMATWMIKFSGSMPYIRTLEAS